MKLDPARFGLLERLQTLTAPEQSNFHHGEVGSFLAAAK
jgi:hypothetical protein